ncbi:hypothetical protein EUTSA_v10027954mg [Eutrema salsugineum]|uniref:Uncharacterized protein n=3 Tax=Eutrema salsugineum TaxID=72664 RepID=V4M3M6_EUTSA|nr:hypothetical protein EUTSA_v10027954mg [Eutrema salsugineum]
MPKLLPQNPFQNTEQRFYVLKKSEVQDNDWIRLYVELAVATTKRNSMDIPDLSNLEILEVAVESIQDWPSVGLGNVFCDAIFYIRYKDGCNVDRNVDRIAMVRRICDERKGCLSLLGRIKRKKDTKLSQSSETVLVKKAKNLRLSSPRRTQRRPKPLPCLGSARPLHKTQFHLNIHRWSTN